MTMIKNKYMIKDNALQNEVPVEEELPTGGEEMVDDSAMRADLKKDFEELDRKKHSLESKKIIAKNKDNDHLEDVLRKVFNEMQKQGVDLNDQKSIHDFLAKLEERDPDLATLFEQAINALAPEETNMYSPQTDLPEDGNSSFEQATTNLGESVPVPSDIPPVAPSPNTENVNSTDINKFDGIRKQILKQ